MAKRPFGRAAADYSGCEDGEIPAKRTPDPAPGGQDSPLQLAGLAEWEQWLQRNHADSPGVWLKIAKKGSGVATVGYPEVLDAAICFGWIDARRNSYDESFFLQRFTPRSPRSKWSQVNRAKATELIKQGRMRQAGHDQISAAIVDGRWHSAYEPQSRATVPEDLQQALDANPGAAEFFATLTGARRYSFLFRLHGVKTAAKRAERITRYIELLSERKTLN